MANVKLKAHLREASQPARILAAQAFSRAAGAPLVHGNSIRLLKDASENYPAWLEAIRSAEKNVHFRIILFVTIILASSLPMRLSQKQKKAPR